jgi:hypothetical protein
MKKLINFGDQFVGRNFVTDVNFALAAIWSLSKGNITLSIMKEDIVELANHYQKKEIGCITEDGATWDDIFDELKEEGLIDLNVNFININQLTIDLIQNAA